MYDKKGDNLMSSENLNSFELVLYLYTVQSTVCTVYSEYSVYSVCPLPFSGGPPLQGQDSPRCLPPSRSPSSSLRPCRHSHRTGCTFSCRFCLFLFVIVFVCYCLPADSLHAGLGGLRYVRLALGLQVGKSLLDFICLFVCLFVTVIVYLEIFIRGSDRSPQPGESVLDIPLELKEIFFEIICTFYISNHVNQQQKSLNHSQLGKQL